MAKIHKGLICLTEEMENDDSQYNQFIVELGNSLSDVVIAATSGNGGFNRGAAVDLLLHALAATLSGTDGKETHTEWDLFMEQLKARIMDDVKGVQAYGHLTIDFDQDHIVYDPEIGWTVTGNLGNQLRN